MAVVLRMMEEESKLSAGDKHAVWLDEVISSVITEESEMVQVFMVVRCYSCKTFQVHQVKKTNKWVCKVCTEKQSVIKVYGKGSGKECRKHVQKLNMVQGEREKREGKGGASHPPCDYANTFTTQSTGANETQVKHPVVLADARNSKWTTFIDPPKDEEDEDCEDDEHTTETERDKLSYGSKARRKSRRSLSERMPRPKAAQEMVCPYSSINLQMESALDDHCVGDMPSAKSRPDRYTKLDTPTYNQPEQRHSHSMLDLSATSAGGPTSHKDRMSEIRKDLEQFSQAHGKRGAKQPANMTDRSTEEQRIPKVSSRWSQFMCEEDSESEEETGASLESSSQHDSTTHILGSKFTIAKFTL